MGYGKLNIWIRSEDCSLVQHCWQSDLMIKTCSGKYLVDLDPTVLEKLKTKYPAPDYEVYRHVTSEGEPEDKNQARRSRDKR